MGFLGAVATIAQMVFLSKVVGRVFMGGGNLGDVHISLFYLLGAVVVRAGYSGAGR